MISPIAQASAPAGLRRAPTSAIRAAGAVPGEAMIDLSLGEPTWFLPPAGLPEVARRALAAATSAPYGAHAGHLELRRAIAEYEGAHPDEVLVTCGAQGALFAVSQACLGEGAVALVPDPGFPAYPALARVTGASVRSYRLGPDFHLDADALVNALDAEPRARLLFLNHPSNPTGGGASRDTLSAVLATCRERGVTVVSDEVYRELCAGEPPLSARTLDRGAVVVGSVSKSCGAPGLRVGWMVADPTLLEVCRGWHAWAVTSASWPAQQAARALLVARHEVFALSRRELTRRWQSLAEAFEAELGQAPSRPAGGCYLWFRTPGRDSRAFVHRLADREGVLVVPGAAFGRWAEGWVRLSLTGSVEQVAEGARRFARFASRETGQR